MNLGRVLIAAFMVAIFLGPRRWMAWAAELRDRVRLIRGLLGERRAPGAGRTSQSSHEPPPQTHEPPPQTREPPPDNHEPPPAADETRPGA